MQNKQLMPELIEEYDKLQVAKCLMHFTLIEQYSASKLNSNQVVSRDPVTYRLQRLIARRDQLQFISVFVLAVEDF